MRLVDLMGIMMQYLSDWINVVFYLIVIYYVGYLGFLKRKKRVSNRQVVIITVLVCYAIMIFGVAFGIRTEAFGGALNLYPLTVYKEAWNSFSKVEWRQIMLNIAMFIPIGMLLPLLLSSFKTCYITYLAGGIIAFWIETFQQLSRRGIFILDDILNRLIGCMIGYGLVMIGGMLYQRLKKKPLVDRWYRIVLYQVPLVVVITSFSVIFNRYEQQELGNLKIAPTHQQNMSGIQVESYVDLSSTTTSGFVYKTTIGTIADAIATANDWFSLAQRSVDETQNIVYDDYVMLHSADGFYHAWVTYNGLTVDYVDFTELQSEVYENYDLPGVSDILAQYGVRLPEDVTFRNEGDGNYRLVVPFTALDDGYITGTLSCSLTPNGVARRINNQLIKSKEYKKYLLISEQEAYEQLTQGQFNEMFLSHYVDVESILITDVSLDYYLDSKGYYQPVYAFSVLVDGLRGKVLIPALSL